MPAVPAPPRPIARLRELLQDGPRIAIVTHHNPDGDAMGSSLGLAHVLRAMGHQVQVVLPNTPPHGLHWMPGYVEAIAFDTRPEACVAAIVESGLLFVLDLNRTDRVGGLEVALKNAPLKVLIDHHQEPEDLAQVIFSEPAMSSTCELVTGILQELGAADHIGPEAATCLYTGIVTDTGSFRYSATTPRTLRMAADLMERGADAAGVHSALMDGNTLDRMRLLGFTLNERLVVLPGQDAAIIGLSKDDLKRFNYKPGDTEGFVNQGLSIQGIRLSVLLLERGDEVKLSFRSKGALPVDRFAREHFNGGGHANAAGGRSTEPLPVVIERLTALLPALIQAHPA